MKYNMNQVKNRELTVSQLEEYCEYLFNQNELSLDHNMELNKMLKHHINEGTRMSDEISDLEGRLDNIITLASKGAGSLMPTC